MIFKKVLNLISSGHFKLSSCQNDKNSICNIYFYVQVLFCFLKNEEMKGQRKNIRKKC